jgi:hypothetical protein
MSVVPLSSYIMCLSVQFTPRFYVYNTIRPYALTPIGLTAVHSKII